MMKQRSSVELNQAAPNEHKVSTPEGVILSWLRRRIMSTFYTHRAHDLTPLSYQKPFHKMSPKSWFLQGPMRQVTEIGNIITLDQPHSHPSKWRILEILHENEYQKYEGADEPSYASILLSCQEVDGSRRQSFMRVVMQVPFFDTEHKGSIGREEQATTFRTPEFLAFMTFAQRNSTVTPHLLGYREDKQDGLGLIPGGFMTYYAWEVVPGEPLGDYTGEATRFWTLDREDRDKIRAAFKDTFL
jgi:hypothetical protein